MTSSESTPQNKSLTLRELVLWCVVVLLVLVILFPGFFLRGDMLSATAMLYDQPPWIEYRESDEPRATNPLMYDPLMAFRPDWLAVQRSLSDGQWPLWNPLELAGVPLMANCQSTIFLPSRLLLGVLNVDVAMSLFILLSLWTAAMVSYISARAFGLSRWPSRFFSIAWGFSCLCLIWAYWPITAVAAWAPALLAGAELLVRGRYRGGFFVLLLGGTMILYAGHPESAFAFALYISGYFAVRAATEAWSGRAPWAALGLYGAAWALALGVYAIQMLPFLEYVANCHPMGHREIPLTPGALAAFWVPRFWGTFAEETFWDKTRYNSNLTIMQYAGMVVWVGVALTLARPAGTRWRWRRQALTLAGVSLIALLVAMNAWPFGRLHVLPGFSQLRMLYHVFFVLLALPALAALGLDKWLSRPRRVRELLWIAAVAVPAALIVAAVYKQNETLLEMNHVLDYVHRELLTALAALLAICALLAVGCFVPRRGAAIWFALIVLAFLDQTWPVRDLNPVLPREGMLPDAALIRYLQEKPRPTRVDVFGAAVVRGTVGNFAIEEWDSYDGLFPARPVQFRNELGRDFWKEMFTASGVEYYLNDPRFEEMLPFDDLKARGALELETTLDNIELYRNVAMLPRARLVGTVSVVKDADAAFERMLSEDFDAAAEVVTEAPPEGPLPQSDKVDVGEARIERYTPNVVEVVCDASQPAALVLADNIFPGWKAYIDGQPAALFPAYYTFRGVLVPAGEHRVAFRYEPLSLKVGYAVSVVSLLIGAGLALHALLRRRSSGVQA